MTMIAAVQIVERTLGKFEPWTWGYRPYGQFGGFRKFLNDFDDDSKKESIS